MFSPSSSQQSPTPNIPQILASCKPRIYLFGDDIFVDAAVNPALNHQHPYEDVVPKSKEEIAEYRRQWKLKNREKIRAQTKLYESRPEVKARIKAYRAANRARQNQLKAEWRARNLEQVRAYGREYNSRPEVKQRMREWHVARKNPEWRAHRTWESRILRAKKFGQEDGACVYCGLWCSLLIPIWEEGHGQIDHKIPRSRGGGNEPENLQLTCFYCNRAKCNLTHDEFLEHIWRLIEFNLTKR